MKSGWILAAALGVRLGAAFAIGCAGEGDEGVGSTAEAVTAGDAGANCTTSRPCGAGLYCAPSASIPACGSGTCTVAPENCPSFETTGVCGCDGARYLNATCANMHDTSAEGVLRIGGAAISNVSGTWTRVVSTNTASRVEVDETLVVQSGGTYTLTQSQKCLMTAGHDCPGGVRILAEALGSVTAGTNGGFTLSSSCVTGNCSSLATEFDLEHNCSPYSAPLHIAISEPPNSSSAPTYFLEKK